jgi:hypothetical protein
MCWTTHVRFNDQEADAISESGLGASAARSGHVIQRVLANGAPGEVEQFQPEALDFSYRQAVVRVGIDGETNLSTVDPKRVGQEPAEEQKHRRVRVRELRAVAALRSLRPVEHAAGLVKQIPVPGPPSPFLLELEPSRATPGGPGRGPLPLSLWILRSMRPPAVRSTCSAVNSMSRVHANAEPAEISNAAAIRL